MKALPERKGNKGKRSLPLLSSAASMKALPERKGNHEFIPPADALFEPQ